MTATHDRPAVRTYGGWRRRRGLGLAGLDGRQSVLVLGAVFTVLIAGVFALRLALLLLVPAALAIGVGIVHWDGVWLVDSLTARVRWAVALRRGHLSLRGAGLVDHPQVCGSCPGCSLRRAACRPTMARAAPRGWSGTGAAACSRQPCESRQPACCWPTAATVTPGWPAGAPGCQP